MMRFVLPVFLSVFLFFSVPSSAAVVGGTYLTVDTSELGSITIYIDSSYRDSFGLNNDLPILLRSSSISGYTLNSSGETVYRITIGSYGNTWSYRSDSSYTSYDLHVLSFDSSSSNIIVAGLDPDPSRLIPYLILFFGLLIIMVIWHKK